MRVPIFSKRSENSDKNCSSLTFTAEIRFIGLRFSVVANPRIDTDFELTTIKETPKLYFRVSEHFPVTGFQNYYMRINLCSLDRGRVQDKFF